MSNAVSQALSVAQLGAAVWPTLQAAERAIFAFSASQGWSLAARRSDKHRYTYEDAQGQERLREVDKSKVWMCSRGQQKDAGQRHLCEDACEQINATGQLAPPPVDTPRLLASIKTCCPVAVRVTMMLKKGEPANGRCWTEQDTPLVGYRLSTKPKELLPCQHNHHSNVIGQGALTESVAQIPEAVREEIKTLVQADFAPYKIRAYIAQKHNLPPMLASVWGSIIRSIKSEMGIHSAGEDLKALIERLTDERNERGAVFDFVVDGDLTVTTIFFMSRAMLESFRRCAQFVVMDSTCKTNRFGMSLFLVCGVDEHMHIVLYASAFMKDEAQPAFEYVLTQIKRAVGMDAWLRMACVATDGCAAMTAALTKVAPHAAQQRCVWHLQQNIIKHTGGSGHHYIIKAWYACVYARTVSEFDAKWAALMQERMGAKCGEYLVKYVLPLRDKWACCSTNQLTNFGSHSTQLVESLNRLLKMWDVDDRTTLSRAIARICTVKEEEATRRQISSMRDHALHAVADTHSQRMDWNDSYKTKLTKFLTGAAAKLCDGEYELCSQYNATLVQLLAGAPAGLFSVATQTYIVKHKEKEGSEYQVHVSPHLIYCPCGHCFTYLLPCRHVLAANLAAFSDIFQPGQYHPRWRLQYSVQVQHETLAKQFWLSVGREVTAAGVLQVKYVQRVEEQAGDALQPEGSGAVPGAQPDLPTPMYDPFLQQLVPAQLTPQHLYHMLEGEAQQVRQLACSNPALLAGMAWMGMHNLKMQLTAHIDRERRSQHQAASAAAAAAQPGAYTSEGIPLSSLLAPVPLTAAKRGRPSSKRAMAAVEGVAARQVRAFLPAHLVDEGAAGGGRGGAGSSHCGGGVVEECAVSREVAAVVAAAAAAASSAGVSGGARGGGVSGAVCGAEPQSVSISTARMTTSGRRVKAPCR
jgi:hypothetical protein